MPRAGLTRQRVVAEAAALADHDGVEALSLAALAGRLGVRVPSLYKHIGGIEDLQRRLALAGVQDLTAALSAATVGRAGPDALRACAAAYRGYARAHPGRYAALQRVPARHVPEVDGELRAASDRLVGLLLAVLRGYGFDGDEAVHAVRALRAALHGFVALEAVGGFGMPQDVDVSFDRLVDVLDDGLRATGRDAVPPS